MSRHPQSSAEERSCFFLQPGPSSQCGRTTACKETANCKPYKIHIPCKPERSVSAEGLLRPEVSLQAAMAAAATVLLLAVAGMEAMAGRAPTEALGPLRGMRRLPASYPSPA